MWESQKKIIFSIIDYGSWIKKWNWLKFEAVSSDFKIFTEIANLFIILEPEMKPKMNPETQTQHCKGIR